MSDVRSPYQSTLKVIIKSFGLNNVVSVPINLNTTTRDIIEYCRDHQEGSCHLIEIWRGCPRKLEDFDRICEHLDQWGVYKNEVKFHLIYDKKNVIESASHSVERMRVQSERNKRFLGSAEMTHAELLEMASRQQQQLEAQHQMLVAREQRLKYLKQQELHHQQMVAENERLRTLREKVEAQEFKLKKIRAIRGQAVDQKSHNSNLGAELETMKALFNEKEKELSIAVNKVDELTKQLHILRKRSQNVRENKQRADALMELDKLRSELLTRQKLNEGQNSKLSKQKEILIHRKSEMASMDAKIAELQARLYKKRQDKPENLHNHFNDVDSKSYAKYDQRPISVVASNIETSLKHSFRDESSPLPKSAVDNKCHTLPNNMKSISDISPDIVNNNNKKLNKKLVKIENNKDLNNFYNKPVCNSQSVQHKENKEHFKNNQNSNYNSISGADIQSFQTIKNLPVSYSNLLPRPYGSSFSTSHTNKLDTGQETEKNSTKYLKTFDESIVSDCYDGPLTSTPKQTSFRSHNSDNLKLSLPNALTNFKNIDESNKVSSHSISSNVYNHSNSSTIPLMNNESHTPNYSQVSSGQRQQFAQWHVTNAPPVVTTSLTQSQSSIYKPASFVNVYDVKSLNHYHKHDNFSYSDHQSEVVIDTNIDNKSFDYLAQTKVKTIIDDSNDTKTLPEKKQAVILSTPSGLKESIDYNSNYSNLTASSSNEKRQGTSSIELKQSSSLYRDFISEKSLSASKKAVDDSNKPFSDVYLTNDHSMFDDLSKDANIIFDHSNDNDGGVSDGNLQESSMSTLSHDLDAERLHYKPIVTKLRRRSSSCENEEVSCMRNKFQNRSTNSDDIVVTSEQIQEKSNLEVIQVNDLMDHHKEYDNQSQDKGDDLISRKDCKSPVLQVEVRKTNLKSNTSIKSNKRVSFDPLALLLDASLGGELNLVKETATLVNDPSSANGEGITALHNAICGGHYEIVQFLVEFGCDVNSPDSDGWTPLHCAASCNNLPMVKMLVEHGACIFATTISDHETAAQKCEEGEDGYDGCSEYLYSIQEKLGIINKGVVYAVYDYDAQNPDELTFLNRDSLVILRKGDENEKEWWWARSSDKEGYVARNLLGLFPRILQNSCSEC